MRIGRNHSLLLALAIASVAIMVAQPMAIGFASASYSATTVNTGNSISADYFTAGLYTYRGSGDPDFIMDYSSSNFATLTVAAFDQGRIPYTEEDDDTYKVHNGITNTAINNLYIAITSIPHHTMVGSTFSLSYTVTGIAEAGFTGNATLVWGGGSPAIELNKAYRLHLSLSDLEYSGTQVPQMTISVAITLTDNNSACYASANNKVTFVVATPVDEFKTELDNANQDLSDQGMGFYTDPGNTSTGEPAGVYIQNSTSQTHSIAAEDYGNSSIDVDIVVPDGIHFCVYVTLKKAANWFSERSEVTVGIKKMRSAGDPDSKEDDVVVRNYGSTKLVAEWGVFISNDVKKYIYLNGSGTGLTNNNNRPSNQSQYIYCEDGEYISISFDGDQTSSMVGTMTVTAKLVMYGV